MKKHWRTGIASGLVLAACLGVGSSSAAEKASGTVIVIPARRAVIQVALDIARTRAAKLISYQGNAETDEPAMYAWDGKNKNWAALSVEEFAAMPPAKKMILVGDEQTVPPVIAETASRSRAMSQIGSLDVASLVRGCGKTLDFTPREYEWLAKRYNLTLTDRNAERRRYGRYGRPRQHTPARKVESREQQDSLSDIPEEPRWESDAAEQDPVPVMTEEPVEEVIVPPEGMRPEDK